MNADGIANRSSVNARVVAVIEQVAAPGVVVEVGGDATLPAELAAVGREHVDVGLDVVEGDLADAIERIEAELAGRPLAAVLARDTLGRLGPATEAVERLAALAAGLGAVPVVVTAPNIAHRDTAIRLLFGRWDPGDERFAASGPTLYDDVQLRIAARSAGLVEVARDDQTLDATRSTLGLDHPARSPATTIREFLDAVRSDADDHGATYRFVRAYRAADATTDPGGAPRRVETPFCSVVVRTLGARSSLHDALTSLAAQTDDDFEVVLTVRSDDADDTDGLDAVRRVVDSYAAAFADRVRVVQVVGGGRSTALNCGLDAARGRYLAFLDDDDVVTADWIEQFRRAALRAPGRIARTLCVAQPHRRVAGGLVDYEPIGGFEQPFARAFDLLEHRYFNQSPICSWAVPLDGVRALRLRFDDALEVCEDWDFLLAAASLLGVSNVEVFTSVYRRFDDDWSASGGIDPDVWQRAVAEVRERHDRRPTLVPAGTVRGLSHLRDLLNHLLEAHPSVVGRIEALERSRYWRVSAPLRWLTSKRPR